MFAFLLKKISQNPEIQWQDLSPEKQKSVKLILWIFVFVHISLIIGMMPFFYLSYRGAPLHFPVFLAVTLMIIGAPKSIQIYRNRIQKILASKNHPLE
ncbi:hypothetical protein [Alysiella crassa]|uniref:Uncharacterized protein n=1 Tax=Alysiella crassa TaxID=153491 RepID=A0A376BU30_9NEIS|nr:hypothetical protein [Alysiella crassa]UOP05997.1 hypothetical protein LVJ80_09040 [Alysiella crassa]SSY80446.1 Uncharacterised protein [Alysiella crassa]